MQNRFENPWSYLASDVLQEYISPEVIEQLTFFLQKFFIFITNDFPFPSCEGAVKIKIKFLNFFVLSNKGCKLLSFVFFEFVDG